MKILIIANRLPVKIERTEDSFVVKRSEGGRSPQDWGLWKPMRKCIGWGGLESMWMMKMKSRRLPKS